MYKLNKYEVSLRQLAFSFKSSCQALLSFNKIFFFVYPPWHSFFGHSQKKSKDWQFNFSIRVNRIELWSLFNEKDSKSSCKAPNSYIYSVKP